MLAATPLSLPRPVPRKFQLSSMISRATSNRFTSGLSSCTKLVLESKGYRTLTFKLAEDFLAHMAANPGSCSILVTDQTMPGMQGTELAAAMRRLTPGLPVVIMSGYFSKISPHAHDELGQVELLAKPFTTDELGHAVHRALAAAGKTG